MEKRKQQGLPAEKSQAIALLVDHIHSIPVSRFSFRFGPLAECRSRSDVWCSSFRAGRTSCFCIWMP
jgi:hypothetical protein